MLTKHSLNSELLNGQQLNGQELKTQPLNSQLLNMNLEPQSQQHLLILDSHQLLLLHTHQELRLQNGQLPLLRLRLVPKPHRVVQAWQEQVLPSDVSSSFHTPPTAKAPPKTPNHGHYGCSGQPNCSSGLVGRLAGVRFPCGSHNYYLPCQHSG